MKLMIRPDGSVFMVYNDENTDKLGQRLLSEKDGDGLGVCRASVVEFSPLRQKWVAVAKCAGAPWDKRHIASGKNRKKVIEDEVKFIENNLSAFTSNHCL